jgi:hypothetical protein
MYFSFNLNNFTLYEIELLKLDCQIRIGGYDIARIKEALAHTLKVDGMFHFQTSHQLTPGDASRITQYSSDRSLNLADYFFSLSVRTRFGIENITLPEKIFCIQIKQYHG